MIHDLLTFRLNVNPKSSLAKVMLEVRTFVAEVRLNASTGKLEQDRLISFNLNSLLIEITMIKLKLLADDTTYRSHRMSVANDNIKYLQQVLQEEGIE